MEATTKQDAIQRLTFLMSTIQMAYYKGRFTQPEENAGFGQSGLLWVHETGECGISIDLYDLFGDNLPACPDLTFDSLCPSDGKPMHQKAYCVSYDPDWEEHTVLVQCNDASLDEFDDSFDLPLDYIPEQTIRSITAWIESLLPGNNENENQNQNQNENE